MVHPDVRRSGASPTAAVGGSTAATAAKRGLGVKGGYIYLHSAVDGFSRPDYTEALADERVTTTIGLSCRARVLFATHWIERIRRIVTENGANYRAKDITRTVEALAGRHHRIRTYTPRHKGKVERHNRLLAAEVLYSRSYASEQARKEAIRI